MIKLQPHHVEACKRALRNVEIDQEAFIVRALHGPEDPFIWKFSTFEFALRSRERILEIVDWLRLELSRLEGVAKHRDAFSERGEMT